MLNQLEIGALKYGEVEAITLTGALVLGPSVDRLRQVVDNSVAHGVSRFVFNLSDLSRLDSTGIGVLMNILVSSKQMGGSLKLVNPSKQVVQTLKMCQLLPLFDVFTVEQEAIASFG